MKECEECEYYEEGLKEEKSAGVHVRVKGHALGLWYLRFEA